MRRSRNKQVSQVYVPEVDTARTFSLPVTDRQMQFVNLLKSMGGRANRYRLFWEFGSGVDVVACALMQKGLVVREREGGKVYYSLTKLGRGEI